MKTVIEMAREAGWNDLIPEAMKQVLERFAALVREDEREKQQEPVLKSYINEEGKLIQMPLYATPPTAAIAARQMRDAAVKVCVDYEKYCHKNTPKINFYVQGCINTTNSLAQEIAELPILGEDK